VQLLLCCFEHVVTLGAAQAPGQSQTNPLASSLNHAAYLACP